jgi:hypothetical protein
MKHGQEQGRLRRLQEVLFVPNSCYGRPATDLFIMPQDTFVLNVQRVTSRKQRYRAKMAAHRCRQAVVVEMFEVSDFGVSQQWLWRVLWIVAPCRRVRSAFRVQYVLPSSFKRSLECRTTGLQYRNIALEHFLYSSYFLTWKRQSCPYNTPRRPIGLWDVEVPTFSR